MGFNLALAGFVIVNIAMGHYFTTIAKEKVPESVVPHSVALVLGGLLGIAGIILAPSAATSGLGGGAAFFAGFLLWLLGQRRTPDGELIAKIGDVLPEFSAPNHNGQMIRIADLRGRRALLKFYRGHW